MKRFHVTTFGCQMNEHDSERMKGMLESLGYAEARERDDADLILFNTCSIREKADERFVAHLGEAKRAQAPRPGAWSSASAAAGRSRSRTRSSASSRSSTSPSAPARSTSSPSSSRRDSLTAQGYFEFEGFTGHLPSQARARAPGRGCRSRVGCNCSCSLLHRPLHPRARGQSRRSASSSPRSSASPADGVREVTLLGQNVNAYGRDLRPQRRSFAELLARASTRSTGIDRIRYTSPHPKDMREDVIRAHAELPSVCEHIHLPLQSRLDPDPEGDAADLHRASATSTASRSSASTSPTAR